MKLMSLEALQEQLGAQSYRMSPSNSDGHESTLPTHDDHHTDNHIDE